MSVISCRDVRPVSRATEVSSRPIYLLERCLAIRFERVQQQQQQQQQQQKQEPMKRPGSSLSQLSTWFPWASTKLNSGISNLTLTSTITAGHEQQQQQHQPNGADPLAAKPLVQESSSPAGWIYDGGFVLFQNFREANGYCYWNAALLDAVASLTFVGHVTPATILVTSDESSLETVRSAWARKVLRAPSAYIIVLVGDVDGCVVQPISQSQFTPLPEALCWVIWELSLAERSTTLDDVTAALGNAFPDLVPPGNKIIYDTLGKLIRDRKIFYNGKGYGVVTPDTYRKTAVVENSEKGLLLTNEEALARAHGTVESYPQGNVVHKAIQTNLVDVICRGNGTEKVLYGRTADELEALAGSSNSSSASSSRRPRLQRQRSLRMFHGSSSKRLSWSEYRSGSGSLRLSSSRAKKLMDEAASGAEWADDGVVVDLTDHSMKTHKEKASLLSRLFRRRSPSKKRTTLCSFSAQFPPPEWTDPASAVAHLHSVAVQTQAADLAASIAQQETQSNKYGTLSARSDCSTSICFSSPAPTRRSMQRRVTLSEAPSVRSESCSPYRQPTSTLMTKLNHDETPVIQSGRTRGSPATSVSSGLGRSFSPASASYQRPLGILCNQSPPSPTQSTDSLYSSSVGPSASAMCRSPVPSVTSKTTTFSHDRPFQRSTPGRASYGAGGRYRTDNQPSATDYQPFQRLAARSASLRQSGDRHVLLGSSTPRPYVPGKLTEQRSLIAQQKSAMRDHFFQTHLSAPPLISSVLNNNNNNSSKPKLSLPRSDELSNGYFSYSLLSNGNKTTVSPPARSVVSSTASANKKYYETDLDLTIKVPKKSVESYQEAKKSSTDSASRVINISVTKSESHSYVSQQNETNTGHVTTINKENADDADKPVITMKSGEDNFRTFPSLTELNINFKSITGQKILQGLNSNSTDTLVELSMRDAEVGANSEISFV